MDTSNYFIYPAHTLTPGDYADAVKIQYGSQQEFSWTTNYDIPLNLALIQETASTKVDTLASAVPLLPLPVSFTEEERADTFYLFQSANTMATSCIWNGRPSQDLQLSDIFFLALYNSSNPKYPLLTSQYINITSSSSSSSATSISASSASSSFTGSSSSTASSSSSSPAVQPNTTPTSATAAASPTTSRIAKSSANHVALGAGVGIGMVGAALILALALFFFLRRKRHNKSGKSRRPEVYQLAENDSISR